MSLISCGESEKEQVWISSPGRAAIVASTRSMARRQNTRVKKQSTHRQAGSGGSS